MAPVTMGAPMTAWPEVPYELPVGTVATQRSNHPDPRMCRSQMIKTWFLQQINVRREWEQCTTRMGGRRVLQNKDINRGSVKPKPM